MEVLKTSDCAVTNCEVLAFLREQRAKVAQSKLQKTGKVATLVLETLSSLEKTPAVNQGEESVAQFLSEMKPFELSSSELLMLCNHCPASPVELHLLVEESEERLDDQQVEKILEIVRRVLRQEEEEEEEVEGEGEEAENEDQVPQEAQ